MKKTLKKLFSFWMVLARFLGKINTFVLLTLVYFLMIGPLATFFKLIRKDLLDIKLSDHKKSYWIKRKMLKEKDYEQQF